jgi:branched-chain amino acid transport system substrate-binding protein
MPGSEMSLNYTAMLATAQAMKLAGTTSDTAAIRAQLDKAFKTLKSSQNPHSIDGVDARGGTLANTRVGVVEGGKIKEMAIASFK